MKIRILLPTLLLPLFPLILMADNILTDDSSSDFQWQPQQAYTEAAVEIPQNIDLNDLQEFQVSANNPRFRYYIERGSLYTGEDMVTRFVVVIRSRSGVTNSSYEGLRCGERLFKTYAYGSADKLFPASEASWQTIPKGEPDNYHATLYDDLICNLLTGRSNQPDAVFRAMADHGTLRSD
jgi:hypothetical protein